jgi:8-oxo-dGTP pyrophosphatase MutT (NUDIX family)
MRTAREAAIFVTRAGKFLLMHRAQDDYWHVAAGVVEEGESFADAAARELREETGLDLPITDLAMPQGYVIPEALRAEYAPGINEVQIENFAVEAPAEWEPVLNEEHDRYQWLDLTDAIALAHWPETLEIIAALAAPRSEAP